MLINGISAPNSYKKNLNPSFGMNVIMSEDLGVIFGKKAEFIRLELDRFASFLDPKDADVTFTRVPNFLTDKNGCITYSVTDAKSSGAFAYGPIPINQKEAVAVDALESLLACFSTSKSTGNMKFVKLDVKV